MLARQLDYKIFLSKFLSLLPLKPLLGRWAPSNIIHRNCVRLSYQESMKKDFAIHDPILSFYHNYVLIYIFYIWHLYHATLLKLSNGLPITTSSVLDDFNGDKKPNIPISYKIGK
ncbi:hypothetical protein BDA99DRAFT_532956 [Phascolomyces articulosus]|uniref:Uncharacterized protein n=1 Tax=Phascolomyces articulosus TaxID=60185 RepID=A0AAD5KKA0_9FUNG|nr:hypothetical protein BDA99DRAFT_532956 [Phascolomyces articulosus]